MIMPFSHQHHRPSSTNRRCGPRLSAWEIFGVLVVLYVVLDTFFSIYLERDSHIHSTTAEMVILRSARRQGAVCLDGSAPGYVIWRGSGTGEKKWLVYLEGGGWCHHMKQCYNRAQGNRGSSKFFNLTQDEEIMQGILSRDRKKNPDFYNWNSVYVKHCDGSSFTGKKWVPERYKGTWLYFRGSFILSAIMSSLVSAGLSSATDVLLAGCSAGGLSALIHCNEVAGWLGNSTRYKCLSDAGLFLDTTDIRGGDNYNLRRRFQSIVTLHNSSLQKECVETLPPDEKWKCAFPANFLQKIRFPVFILNSFYDSWQIRNSFVPNEAGDKKWRKCKKFGGKRCSADQLDSLQRYQNETVLSVPSALNLSQNGVFLTSCFLHCQSFQNFNWLDPRGHRIRNPNSSSEKSVSEAVGDWYFEKRDSKWVDCKSPCNPTCSY